MATTYKTYQLNRHASQYSLHIRVQNHTQFVIFRNIGYGSVYSTGAPRYQTRDKHIQQGIEASKAFRDGKVLLVDEVPINPSAKKEVKKDESDDTGKTLDDGEGQDQKSEAGNTAKKIEADETDNLDTYPEVTTFKAAREILTSPPYNVPKTSKEISNKEKVFQKAAELGVSFPKLRK